MITFELLDNVTLNGGQLRQLWMTEHGGQTHFFTSAINARRWAEHKVFQKYQGLPDRDDVVANGGWRAHPYNSESVETNHESSSDF